MARKKRIEKQLESPAEALIDYAAKTLAAAEQLRMKTKVVGDFPLEEGERAIVASLSALPAKLKKKLLSKDASFTIAETARLVMAVAKSCVDAKPMQEVVLLLLSKKLLKCLHSCIAIPVEPANGRKPTLTDTVYQFKITLIGVTPPIWRRIQVRDCTLDKLHEHIQTSMGWMNSHLHHFRVGEKLYGDPMLMEEDFNGIGFDDSTSSMLSRILPRSGKRLRFVYEYDFGDSWEHEVVFEGCPKSEAGHQYPSCLEGERCCPPEDVGGVGGYADFLETIGNRKHERHDEMLEWVGGSFDPEEFDPVMATKAMKKGLPDWRRMM